MPRFDGIGNFQEGLAQVNISGKWGFMDKMGKEVIPPTFDFSLPFQDGMARVVKNGKWGAIDKTGKIVIPFLYEELLVYNGMGIVTKNKKVGVMDKTGKELVKPKYDEIPLDFLWRVGEDSSCPDEIYLPVKKDGKWGFIKLKIPPSPPLPSDS